MPCCREAEGPCVELDLACGLFDLKDEAALAAAERSLIAKEGVRPGRGWPWAGLGAGHRMGPWLPFRLVLEGKAR